MGEVSDLKISGEMCNHCGVMFIEEHGHPVLCKDCFKDDKDEEEQSGLPKAKKEEL